MARRIVKHYSKDPNPWINLLGKNGIRVYPEYDRTTKDKFMIAIEQEGKPPIYGKKRYTTENVLDGLYEALEYMYNKIV